MTETALNRHYTLGAALVAGLLVGAPLRGLEWLWLGSGISLGESPGALGQLLLSAGPLINVLVGLVPGWVAGWLYPRSGISAGLCVGLILQLLALVASSLRYGGIGGVELGGMLAGLVESALFAAAAGGSAQLIRMSGGFAGYFGGASDIAASVPVESAQIESAGTQGTFDPGVAIPPAKAPSPHILVVLLFFLAGFATSLCAAAGLAIVTADHTGNIGTLLVAGVAWLIASIGLLIGLFFLLRRVHALFYVVTIVFIAVPLLVAFKFLGF